MSASSTEQRGRFAGISPQSERGLIAFLAALSGLSALGIDVLLPALGDIRAAYDLAPDSTRVSLVVTTYLFGLGIGQVVYGPIADRFGRKPAVLAGLSLYAANPKINCHDPTTSSPAPSSGATAGESWKNSITSDTTRVIASPLNRSRAIVRLSALGDAAPSPIRNRNASIVSRLGDSPEPIAPAA